MHIVACVRALGGIAQAALDPGLHGGQFDAVFRFKLNVDQRVVAQVLADARQIINHRNTQLTQVSGGTDA